MSRKMKAREERGLYWDRALTLVEGCTPISPGCAHCWSAAATSMRAHQSGKTGERYSGLTNESGCFNGTVRFQSQALSIPLRVKKPTTFAVWNDLFHEGVTDKEIADSVMAMKWASSHTFLVLTKRSERSLGIDTDGIGNVWRGVTVEDQQRAERVRDLIETPAAMRWISFEPLLGPVLSLPWGSKLGEAVQGAVIGAESGRDRRECQVEWVRELKEMLEASGVKVWIKQLHIDGRVSKDMSEWPEDLRVREMPEHREARG